MVPEKRVGRVVGLLLLLHFVAALVVPYILLDRALAQPFLVNAGSHAALVRTAVILFMLGAALVLAVAIAAWPVFRVHTERLGIAFMAIAVANASLQLVESGTLLTMLSLSEQFATRAAADATVLQAAGAAAQTARRSAHYTQLLTVVTWLFVLYLILWRTALVPRLVAAAGILTTLLQIAGVPARAILGYGPVMAMAMPLAPVHLVSALWLIVKGFGATVRRKQGIRTAEPPGW
jgi:hypothetical protein